MGFPRALVWRGLRPFTNDFGMGWINATKFASARWQRHATYRQTHVEFAFLLDYVPNWRLAYSPQGFIQYQPFVPKEHAQQVFGWILEHCQLRGDVPYLVVFKRHRPDPFLLTHGVDGYSLAMDFKVHDRERLWRLCHEISERVVAAGGRFYVAKDAVIRPKDVLGSWGEERIAAFRTLKAGVDPQGLLRSDQVRRAFGDLLDPIREPATRRP
jgi:FAD/FMN-containing dehydrogenase